MRAHGKVNLIGLAIVAAILAGLYWVLMFSTVYLEKMDMGAVVAAAYNQAGQTNDETIQGRVIEAANHIGKHMAEDGFGNMVEVKGLGLTNEDVTVFRDEVRNTILIKVEYSQEVELKPFSKIHVVHFVIAQEGPVRAP